MQAVNIKELEEKIACMRASWDSFLTEATAVATSMGIKSQLDMRQRKRKRFFDEAEKQGTEEQSPETQFRDSVSCCNGQHNLSTTCTVLINAADM